MFSFPKYLEIDVVLDQSTPARAYKSRRMVHSLTLPRSKAATLAVVGLTILASLYCVHLNCKIAVYHHRHSIRLRIYKLLGNQQKMKHYEERQHLKVKEELRTVLWIDRECPEGRKRTLHDMKTSLET